MLALSQATNTLLHDGAKFDPWALSWLACDEQPRDALAVTPLAAVNWLFSQAGVRRVVVGVIGPKQASVRQMEIAGLVGRRLAELGVPMISGGRSGVMEAACRGNLAAGGLPIGILPGDEWTEANAYVAIPLATGLGPARNAVIARAAVALLAVGGGYGTLSEMAFGLHFERLVIALEDAPAVPGAVRCADVESALDRVAQRILALDS